MGTHVLRLDRIGDLYVLPKELVSFFDWCDRTPTTDAQWLQFKPYRVDLIDNPTIAVLTQKYTLLIIDY